MADEKLANAEDEELIPVETPIPEPKSTQDADDGAEDDENGDQEDDDGEDERLAEQEDDEDAEKDDNPNRKKRLKRKQTQKAARDRLSNELRLLREQNERVERELSILKGNSLQQNEIVLDDRLAQAKQKVAQADHIIAQAINAGNGEDVIAAQRIRDEAKDEERQLETAKRNLKAVREAPPQPDPRVQSLGAAWKEANPWYNTKGGDEASDITNAIDNALAREGYNPKDASYWEELTRRVKMRLAPEPKRDRKTAPETAQTEKRKPPPMGSTREHAPVSTRREIYVSPERKAALMSANKWDDPVLRNRALKYYENYDREQAALKR